MNFVGSVPRGRAGTSGYAGTSGVSGYSGYAPASDPSAIVSGAGTAAANGTYSYRGQGDVVFEGGDRAFYNLIGQPTDITHLSIGWDSDAETWGIYGAVGQLYFSFENVAFPYLVATWLPVAGDLPAPTVTQG